MSKILIKHDSTPPNSPVKMGANPKKTTPQFERALKDMREMHEREKVRYQEKAKARGRKLNFGE